MNITARVLLLGSVVAGLPALGCADRQPPRGSQDGTEADRNDTEVVARARYLSALAFASAVTGGSTLYLDLLNESTATDLIRDYRGWLAEGVGWREILRLRDTLPVPRAAWRVLPGEGLDVLVGDGPEILGLVLEDSTHRFQLLAGPVIAEWTGPTGQRELLRHASLVRDSLSEPGFLFFRRAGRSSAAPKDRGEDELFLLADALGNGLLVARTGTLGETEAVAWSWFDGVAASWFDATIQPAPARAAPSQTSGSPGWSLSIPSASFAAELRRSAERPGFALVTGTLLFEGKTRPVHGIQLLSRLP